MEGLGDPLARLPLFFGGIHCASPYFFRLSANDFLVMSHVFLLKSVIVQAVCCQNVSLCFITLSLVRSCYMLIFCSVFFISGPVEKLKCNDCGNLYGTKFALESHVRRAHTKDQIEASLICRYCGRKFGNVSSLLKHENIHLSEEERKPFKCEDCGRRYSGYHTLQEHMNVHSGVKPFACDTCGKSFARKANLDQHVVIHSDEKPFSCDQCDMSFSWKSHLRAHLRKHEGLRPHKCEHCEKSFSERSILRLHMRSIHQAELPYKDNKIIQLEDPAN